MRAVPSARVDLHPINATPTADEIAAVDSVCGPLVEDRTATVQRARGRRQLLLPALHAVQARVGWVSKGALAYVCRRLHVPPAEGYGVASFYGWFALAPRTAVTAHVCDDIACKLAGADALCDELTRDFSRESDVKRVDGSWQRSPCLGLCERAPAALVTAAGAPARERALGHATADLVRAAIAAPASEDPPRTILPQPASELVLLRRVGHCDPGSLDDYRAHGGYEGLRRALDLGPAGVVREVTDAKLLGRGGAAFPTGRKWEAVARATPRPHYVVCNADESEPGTFKDRVLMEDDPFAVVEAMTIAGLATGAEHGFVYVRAEYPLAAARLVNAIDMARARGLLGENVMGKGLVFDIELRRGAGAYICGEETALFNSLEGFRGEPRNKPPFPVDVGLFGKPTCINNVETLVSALCIVRDGAAAWSAIGTAGSTGSKLFCLSGHVRRAGLYEVPFGTRIDHLIEKAGGVRGGRALQAVLLGGAAGAFVLPDELATPLTFEDTRRIGATIGSGVVMLLDDTVNILDMCRRMAAFFRDESCGQCVPCRVGTVRVEELLTRATAKSPLGSLAGERALLQELSQAMRDASICGLGQTATSAVESAVNKLHILGKA